MSLKYILGGFIIFSSIILLYQLGVRMIINKIAELLDKKLNVMNIKNIQHHVTK